MTGVRRDLETDPTITCVTPEESKALLLGHKPLRHCLMQAGAEASNYPHQSLTTTNYVQSVTTGESGEQGNTSQAPQSSLYVHIPHSSQGRLWTGMCLYVQPSHYVRRYYTMHVRKIGRFSYKRRRLPQSQYGLFLVENLTQCLLGTERNPSL